MPSTNNKTAPNVPYRGIESFRLCDKDIFFARRDETEELLRFVTMYRGVLFYGDSGSGKSSLINAGFLPAALNQKFLPHRLRVQPRLGEEIVVERISTSADSGPPYLSSIFDDRNSESRQVVSVASFKAKLAQFRVSDFEERLAARLRGRNDSLSSFIKDHLSRQTIRLLREEPSAPLTQELRLALTTDLDKLLKSKPLYSKARFRKIELPREILSVLTSGADDADLIGFNRLLLELAYPDKQPSITKCPLLIFDQFEEFVTLFEIAPRGDALREARDAQKAILEMIVELLKDASLPVKLVFVFREDYLAKLTKLFIERPELTDQYLRLTPIKVERLNDIIQSPFSKFPGAFQPEFSDTLVNDLRMAFEGRSESGNVNLSEVQTACLRLWQSSDPENLFRQKGIQGLLEEYLSDALNKFADELRNPSIGLLTRLVTDSGTRNVVSKEDLLARLHQEDGVPVDLLEQSLDKLETDTKLIRRERRYETYFYEIVSEFLVPWISRQKIERRVELERRRLLSQIETSRFEEKARDIPTRASFEERKFIDQVEAAAPEEFASMLVRPSLEEERALRSFFGDLRYQRLHSLALQRRVTQSSQTRPKGNLIIIPGLGGSTLSVSSGGMEERIWMSAFGIRRWGFDVLKLADDGRSPWNPKLMIKTAGISKRSYGELILALSLNWNVKTFSFDWRKDLNLAADELNLQVKDWFDDNAPVHIVAHSTGGLVARTYLKRYHAGWKRFWDVKGKGRAGGRLVMLGTPNQGSFITLQIITGLEGMVRKLALIDSQHEVKNLLQTFSSFSGLYQTLPSPIEMPSAEVLYHAGTYAKFGLAVPQDHLDNALAGHSWLRSAFDFDRTVYVNGYDQITASGVLDWTRLDSLMGYKFTLDGDGYVFHKLGLRSPSSDSKQLNYWIKENHGNLITNGRVLKALDEVLETGWTSLLPRELTARRTVKTTQRQFREKYEEIQRAELQTLQWTLPTLGAGFEATSAGASSSNLPLTSTVAPGERKIEELLTNRFLYFPENLTEKDAAPGLKDEPCVEIGLVYGSIASIDYERVKTNAKCPVDAIAVGHYSGVEPQRAELSLDSAISYALHAPDLVRRSDLLITKLVQCGFIQGRLGQLFLIQDPRLSQPRARATDRQIVIAGMGEPGRFGVLELITLSSGLTWALAQQNRKHLATVLIGSGDGNLSLRDALSGWLTGIRHALRGSRSDSRGKMRITFVENDPRKVSALDQILARERSDSGFMIDYKELSPQERKHLKSGAMSRAKHELTVGMMIVPDDPADGVPVRVSIRFDPDKNSYFFGAITEVTVVPERDTVIDPNLLWTANNELPGEQVPEVQLERGRFLEGLLMPPDLRKQLYGAAPLVMMLDATTARIHWEMVAQPSMDSSPLHRSLEQNDKFEYEDSFLGTSRGFTRQLRTFAPSPEPPPPPQSVLRVLIVADPAEDAHLPGAEEEAVAVADLFESYGSRQQAGDATRVEVKRLFGPIDATRTNVLRELMLRPYDILHFTGHCVYQWDGDPSLSGWIFNAERKDLLSANELNRDRIPKFVFSNACESGITPDRAEARNDRLAPSFAEAFFNRGVANFVCAAWPVDDVGARVFAVTLYSHLLGIQTSTNGGPASGPEPMHEAMRQARLTIADTPNGRTAWGAYQHYGNPYFRLFYERADVRVRNLNRRPKQNGAKPTKKTRSVKAKKTTKSRKPSK